VNKRFASVLVGVVAAGAALLSVHPAEATSRSVLIYNSVNSESGFGIINYGSASWNWILFPGYTANNRAGAANADTRGYYIGPGWCARLFTYNLALTNPTWVFVGTTGVGNHYPVNSSRIYGVETHPANRGGVHGCG
jgi:hypothetical protein